MLDWARSPFLAAYFAFTAAQPEATEGMVRIFELDAFVWGRNTYQVQLISDPFPSLAVKTFDPVANLRCVPQESVHLFCNVDDVQTLIAREKPKIEKSLGTPAPLLRTYDLPLSERKNALSDLAGMGITADKLFPGDYGVCRAAKERWLYPFVGRTPSFGTPISSKGLPYGAIRNPACAGSLLRSAGRG